MWKWLLIIICASVLTVVSSEPENSNFNGEEIPRYTEISDSTKNEARRRRQTEDTAIEFEILKGLEVRNLQNDRSTYPFDKSTLNTQPRKTDIESVLNLLDVSKLKQECYENVCIIDAQSSPNTDKGAQILRNVYSNSINDKSQYFQHPEDRGQPKQSPTRDYDYGRPPPPPPPEDRDYSRRTPPPPPPEDHDYRRPPPPPPPPEDHDYRRPPPPPPPPRDHYWRRPPPPPPHHHHRGPPHHHHRGPPPHYRPDHYSSNYDNFYDKFDSSENDKDNARSDEDRNTRQSYYHNDKRESPSRSYDGRPPGHRGPPSPHYDEHRPPPYHRGPPPRDHGGPPSRWDHRGPPPRWDHGGPPPRWDHGGPPPRWDHRGPPPRWDHRGPPPRWDHRGPPPPQDNEGPSSHPHHRDPSQQPVSTDQPPRNSDNKPSQPTRKPEIPDDGSTSGTSTTEEQYLLDVRFADDENEETTKSKRSRETSFSLTPFIFQATPVTPASD